MLGGGGVGDEVWWMGGREKNSAYIKMLGGEIRDTNINLQENLNVQGRSESAKLFMPIS